MSRIILRVFTITAVAAVLGACEGRVNDDENFFVLTFRSSTDVLNAQANGPSSRPVLTPDERFLVFSSRASNLVPVDTNNRADIFRKNLSSGDVVLVSIDTSGVQANGDSINPSVSDDGRFVAFESVASNLVAGDNNNLSDVFVRDLQTNITTRISVANGAVLPAPGPSINPAISADGNFVAFESQAKDLVVGDTNNFSDIFVRDLAAAVTTRVSVTPSGTESNGQSFHPSISGDGALIAFESWANNLATADTVVTPPSPGIVSNADIFVVSWESPIPLVERISLEHPSNPDGDNTDGSNPNGDSTFPRLSHDGRIVVFLSTADDLVPGDNNNAGGTVSDVFSRDRSLGSTVRVSTSTQGGEPTRSCSEPAISADGRWILFTSDSPDLVGGDTNNTNDIFLRDTVLNTTTRVSVATYGRQSAAFFPNQSGTVSGSGRLVAFVSAAPDLAPNDTNGVADIFIRGPLY